MVEVITTRTVLKGRSIRKVENCYSVSYPVKLKYQNDWAKNKEHLIGANQSWMILLFISSEPGVFKVRESLDWSKVS